MIFLLTIGLEIHLKIKSPNKLFCKCENKQNFDTLIPNTNICPICTAQPGALPVLNYEPLLKSLILGKTLNCKINEISSFDRKSYFYPDQPSGYQITQLYKPTNINGQVTFYTDNNYSIEKTISIRDAHIETDTGKMIHNGGQSLIDFNRAGTPLVEIVTNPDFETANEVSEFLKELQRIAKYNNISNADMDKGQMRIDVNISIRKSKNSKYGTRVELKNINSFGMVRRAIENEYQRQIKLLKQGKKISQETRKRNDQEGKSYSMRSKESTLDYRYFPEPDLPPIKIDNKIKNIIKNTQIEIPHQIIKKFKIEFGFNKEYINTLISNKKILDYFFNILKKYTQGEPNKEKATNIAKRISGPISAYLKENYININELKFNTDYFIDFLSIIDSKKIINNQLKEIIEEMLNTGKHPQKIIEEKGFGNNNLNNKSLEIIINNILKNNQDAVNKYKNGKTSTIGFLIGQIMKETKGKANPKQIQEIIKKLLN